MRMYRRRFKSVTIDEQTLNRESREGWAGGWVGSVGVVLGEEITSGKS